MAYNKRLGAKNPRNVIITGIISMSVFTAFVIWMIITIEPAKNGAEAFRDVTWSFGSCK